MDDVRPLQYDIMWANWEGLPITDINFKNYDLAIEFMWEQSFMQNVVYKGLGLHELPEMKRIYYDYCRHILRNECSVMVLDETETQIVAVALLEWMTDEWHSWVFLPAFMDKGLFQRVVELKANLMATTKSNLNVSNFDSLVVHEIGIPDELSEDPDFIMTIFDVFGMVGQHMHMPLVAFIGLSTKDQDAADMAEYTDMGRTIYSIYKVENQRPFDRLRDLDEMYAVLFVLPLEPIVHYLEWPGFEAFHEALRAQERKREEEQMRLNEM